MTSTSKIVGIPLALALTFLISAGSLSAQGGPAYAHLGHVATAFGGTPNGNGLLPTALAEAQTAIQHAGLAASDLEDLGSMQTHTTHVLRASTAPEGVNGPGLGFGVQAAANGIAQHIELGAGAEGAPQPMVTHAPHIAAAARTVAARAGEIEELAAQIADADSAEEAAPLVEELQTLANQLMTGEDANGDGEISWQEGEGGLEHAQQHLGFIQSALGQN